MRGWRQVRGINTHGNTTRTTFRPSETYVIAALWCKIEIVDRRGVLALHTFDGGVDVRYRSGEPLFAYFASFRVQSVENYNVTFFISEVLLVIENKFFVFFKENNFKQKDER